MSMVDPITTTVVTAVAKNPEGAGKLIGEVGKAGSSIIDSGTSGASTIIESGSNGVATIIQEAGTSKADNTRAAGDAEATKTEASGNAQAQIIGAKAKFIESMKDLPPEVSMEIVRSGALTEILGDNTKNTDKEVGSKLSDALSNLSKPLLSSAITSLSAASMRQQGILAKIREPENPTSDMLAAQMLDTTIAEISNDASQSSWQDKVRQKEGKSVETPTR